MVMSNAEILQREKIRQGYNSLSPSKKRVLKGFIDVIAVALVAMIETDEKNNEQEST